ncbi:hypothetical protein HK102_000110 [Quaeritorhiza haematococci]|nr:hypothetical protein HK102_000110 [Quaeritorhiza haematococci]
MPELYRRTDCECYPDATFFSLLNGDNITQAMARDPRIVGLSTYSYKDPTAPYYNDINHDSYTRPEFETSYAYAFSSTIEWIYNVEKWANSVNNTFLPAVKTYNLSQQDAEQLQADKLSAFAVSYSTKQFVFGENDGHWKGAGSGNTAVFGSSVVQFARRNSTFSQLVTQKEIWRPLVTPPLYSSNMNIANNTLIQNATSLLTPYSQLQTTPTGQALSLTNHTAIVVRTLSYNISRRALIKPDLYAVVTVDSFESTEAPMVDSPAFEPWWTTIKFVPKNLTKVSIGYSMYQTGEGPTEDYSLVPITDTGSFNGTFYLGNNSLTVAHPSNMSIPTPAPTIRLTISSNTSTINFYISHRSFGFCPGTTTINNTTIPTNGVQAFCNNTAYGEYGIFSPICGMDTGSGGGRPANAPTDSPAPVRSGSKGGKERWPRVRSVEGAWGWGLVWVAVWAVAWL